MANEIDDVRGDSPVAGRPPHLRRLPGDPPVAPVPPDHVRLLREFKGLTVRDLLRDEAGTARLPGRSRRALSAIERGDLATADAVLPGRFVPVLQGPGTAHRACRRRRVRIAGAVALLGAGLLCLWIARLLASP